MLLCRNLGGVRKVRWLLSQVAVDVAVGVCQVRAGGCRILAGRYRRLAGVCRGVAGGRREGARWSGGGAGRAPWRGPAGARLRTCTWSCRRRVITSRASERATTSLACPHSSLRTHTSCTYELCNVPICIGYVFKVKVQMLIGLIYSLHFILALNRPVSVLYNHYHYYVCFLQCP